MIELIFVKTCYYATCFKEMFYWSDVDL